jgi:cell division protein FtsN
LKRAPGSYEAPEARRRLDALATTEVEAPAPPEAGNEENRFSIQAGAFSVRENADELSARLQARGLAAVRVVPGEDGLFRVLWGRFEDRYRAEAEGDSIGADLGLGFSIVRAP